MSNITHHCSGIISCFCHLLVGFVDKLEINAIMNKLYKYMTNKLFACSALSLLSSSVYMITNFTIPSQ